MATKTKGKRALPPALAKRATAMATDKKVRLLARGKGLLALVRDKRRVVAMAFYEMGQALHALSAPDVFGALGHKTFEDLVDRKLKMSLSQADRLIATARMLGEEQAVDLGYEKSLAVASALALPGAKLTGAALVLGKRTLDTTATSAADIEAAVTAARHERQKPGRRGRGNTTTPGERGAAERSQAELRRAGAKTATVRVVATKPGQPADVVLRLRSSDVAALAKLHWAKLFTPKG